YLRLGASQITLAPLESKDVDNGFPPAHLSSQKELLVKLGDEKYARLQRRLGSLVFGGS
ncbi:hypothetical protein MTO96_035474, partial [Rhipicephalus appendiculatus]